MPKTSKRRVIVFAPYHQCETALYASAISSFIIKKLSDSRKYDFEYITADNFDGYCSPLIDHVVHRVVSPNDFRQHLHDKTILGDDIDCKLVYWFDLYKEYLSEVTKANNYIFGDYTKWDNSKIVHTRKHIGAIFPAEEVTERMRYSLTSCYGNHTVYPGSFRTLQPLRERFLENDRLKIIISLCGLKNPNNRIQILQQVINTLKTKNGLFFTLLIDGRLYKEEKELVEILGLEYSDKCLVLQSFSDFEYLNLLKQHDMFVDLNPANGIGYLLTAALHQGLVVCGFDQLLYRDILDDGKFGILLKGNNKEYGYGFQRVVPNWDKVFRLFNERVFDKNFVYRTMQLKNDCPKFVQTLEDRLSAFVNMWQFVHTAKHECYSFAE